MEMLSAAARVHVTTVIGRRELAPDVIVLELHAPELGLATRPGQFVMAIPPSGECAATALGIYEAEKDRISLLFFVCGKRTSELASMRVGDRLDCSGPLGNGFDISRGTNVAIVAGGVGIASVLLPAQALLRTGARVTLYYGARSSDRLVEADRFASEGCELRVATDDGSNGHHGFVTERLTRDQHAADPFDMILACGPTPMLRAVARIAGELDIPAQLSLEETFACGVGGCWGCVVPLVRSSAQAPSFPPAEQNGSDVVYARVCKEGPVFWAHELRW